MSNSRRSRLDAEADRQLHVQMLREGQKLRTARRRRRWTQMRMGMHIGLSQSAVSKLERGVGGAFSILTWQKVAIVLALPLKLQLGPDAMEEPADAGHLGLQELILRLGRTAGRRRTFELATKPAVQRARPMSA